MWQPAPEHFVRRLAQEFPANRLRWSAKLEVWQLEQKIERGHIATMRVSPLDDDAIRAQDGYRLVLSISPGDRMKCPNHCGATLKVPIMEFGEAVCKSCKSKGVAPHAWAASYWELSDHLLEHLRLLSKFTLLRPRVQAMDRMNAWRKQKVYQEGIGRASYETRDDIITGCIPRVGYTGKVFDSAQE